MALLLVLRRIGLVPAALLPDRGPYASVARIDGQVWSGRWIRSLHRFASDAAVVAIAVHAVRMLLRGRSWGPRTLAWLSGLVLVGLFVVIGWTGFVMVWDIAGPAPGRGGRPPARCAARLLRAGRPCVPGRAIDARRVLLSQLLPPHRGATRDRAGAVHPRARLARATHCCHRARLIWALTGLLTALAIVWPVPLGAAGRPGIVSWQAPLDWFYGFWLPLTRELPGWPVWAVGRDPVRGRAGGSAVDPPQPRAGPAPSYRGSIAAVHRVRAVLRRLPVRARSDGQPAQRRSGRRWSASSIRPFASAAGSAPGRVPRWGWARRAATDAISSQRVRRIPRRPRAPDGNRGGAGDVLARSRRPR